MHKQRNIFMAFFRSGILGFGGGPASIPLIQKEVVDTYQFMDEEEFGDILAIANTLPGPIATKLAGYIGYHAGGVTGLINALLATILPTVLLMIALLASLSNVKDFDWVKGMTAGVVPVVAMMMAVLTYRFVKKSGEGFGWIKGQLFIVLFFIILEIIGIHPGILIGLLLLTALFLPAKQMNPEREGDR